jgi:hypothetical protein
MEDKEWFSKLRELFFSPRLEEVNIDEAIALKYRYIPRKLFKYREFGEYSLDNLKNNTLWCDSANRFNDPYDTSIYFEYAKETLEQQLIRSIEEQCDKGLFQFLTVNEIESLKKSSEPTRLLAKLAHEKTDGKYSEDKFYRFLNSNTQENVEQMNMEFNRVLKSGYKVCSLSERSDSMLMWSHYAKEHSGFVMEYDFGALPIENVLTRMLWPVIYDDKLFDASAFFEEGLRGGISSNMLGVIASLHKTLDWAYEQEWRLIILSGPNESSFNRPCPKVKAIYIGALAQADSEKKLVEIGMEKGIAVYKMQLSHKQFQMSPKVIYEP